MRHAIIGIATILLAIIAGRASERWLVSSISYEAPHSIDEVFYLPKPEVAHIISAGYHGTLSDILWFYGLSYFGKHYRSDQDYQWLYSYCELVTLLDPYKLYAYRFCALMLAWESEQPDLARAVLSRGIETMPQEWVLRFFRGFVSFHFLKDNKSAVDDFVVGATLPDADPALVGMAQRLGVEGLGVDATRGILEGLLASTNDPEMRRVIKDRMARLDKPS